MWIKRPPVGDFWKQSFLLSPLEKKNVFTNQLQKPFPSNINYIIYSLLEKNIAPKKQQT